MQHQLPMKVGPDPAAVNDGKRFFEGFGGRCTSIEALGVTVSVCV